ncbi:FHA domain-containing protein [Myxococcota bacterium]|nr:FHA domain-containing protein [Myxococcota bacterium]
MKVILEVDKGPNLGSKYELTPRSYRAVGRSGGAEVTVQLSREGDRQLEPDDVRVVEAHLQKRDRSQSEEPAGNLRIGAYRRGRDILLDDDKISRKHAMFFLDDDGPSVVDLLSTNGTHVNGKRVSDSDLAEGDIVNVGRTRFIIRLEDETTESP